MKKKWMAAFLVLSLSFISFTCNQVFAFTGEQELEKGEYLRDLGLIRGDDYGNLHEDSDLNRAEAVVIILRMLRMEEEVYQYDLSKNPFTDIHEDYWYAPYVLYANDLGIVNGVSKTEFDPKGKVTSKQLLSMFLRATGYSADWAKEDIMEKSKKFGLLKNFDPEDENAPNTRGEAFIIFANAIELPQNPEKYENPTCVLTKVLMEKDQDGKENVILKYPELNDYLKDTYKPSYEFLGVEANEKKESEPDKKEAKLKFLGVEKGDSNNRIDLLFNAQTKYKDKDLEGVIVKKVEGEPKLYDLDWYMDRDHYAVRVFNEKVYIIYRDPQGNFMDLRGLHFDIDYEVELRYGKERIKGSTSFDYGQVPDLDKKEKKDKEAKPEEKPKAKPSPNPELDDPTHGHSHEEKAESKIKFIEAIKGEKANRIDLIFNDVIKYSDKDLKGIRVKKVSGYPLRHDFSWYLDSSKYTVKSFGNKVYIEYKDEDGKTVDLNGIVFEIEYKVEHRYSSDKAEGTVTLEYGEIEHVVN